MTHHTDPRLGRQSLAPQDLFRGERVRLAAAGTKEYNEAYARWSEDAEFVRNFQTSPAIPQSVSKVEEHSKKELNSESEFNFAIHALDDDKVIGIGGVEVAWSHQVADLFIGIGDAAYRGKGYGTDAVRLIVSYAFRELGVHRVHLIVIATNARAIRCYEKVGFQREVVMRQSNYRDGQRTDVLAMGILRDEWEATQPAPVYEDAL